MLGTLESSPNLGYWGYLKILTFALPFPQYAIIFRFSINQDNIVFTNDLILKNTVTPAFPIRLFKSS